MQSLADRSRVMARTARSLAYAITGEIPSGVEPERFEDAISLLGTSSTQQSDAKITSQLLTDKRGLAWAISTPDRHSRIEISDEGLEFKFGSAGEDLFAPATKLRWRVNGGEELRLDQVDGLDGLNDRERDIIARCVACIPTIRDSVITPSSVAGTLLAMELSRRPSVLAA
jgi:hypothetical protein